MKSTQLLIHLFTFMLFTTVSNAQSYQYTKNFNDDVYNLIPCHDEMFYSISIHPGCGHNSFTLRYLDEKGEVIWGKETPIFVGHLSVFEGVTDENNTLTLLFYSSGYNSLLKVDKFGDVLFYKSFNPTGYKFNSIAQIKNSLYLTGSKNETDLAGEYGAVVVKVSDNGEYQWAKAFKKPAFSELVFNDCVSKGDSLIIGGYSEEFRTYPFIGMMDTMGNFSAVHEYVIDSMALGLMFFNYTVTNIDFQNDEIIYARFREVGGSYGYTMRLNPSLEVDWRRKFISPGRVFCATPQGGVFMNKSGGNSAIVELDETGEILHYYASSLSELEYEIAYKMYRSSCGYLIGTSQGDIGSSSDTYAHIPFDDGFCEGNNEGPELNDISTSSLINRLIDLDEVGKDFSTFLGPMDFMDTLDLMTTYCSSTYDCTEPLKLDEFNNGAEIFVYPNPGSDFIHVNVENGTFISVYNSIGNSVYQGRITNGGISISHLSSGIYVLKVNNATLRFVVK